MHGSGQGSISAFTDALHKAIGLDIQVVQFEEMALSEGSDAMALAFVQVSIRGQRYTASAKDTDTLSASLGAIVHAVNIAVMEGAVAA